MNCNSLIEEIKEALKKTHVNADINSQSGWTYAFKESLRSVGIKNNFIVYPNPACGEWLFDLCWANEGKDWKTEFKGLTLACEIEWSINVDEIIYDFQKLTVVDADIRLIIFQYNDEEKLKKIINAIENASEHTKSKGYKYLIAASGNKESEIIITNL